ncbi:hypothetical protein BTR14_18785 [Rhizobium rhizosphaerae]|uniref:Serine/threonine protein phosphatase n=1 Tax=Xaviernesmea rhizosphaerae TaxID=1672749 RepID=A0ABX3P9I2_9HYPH|nr:hypothetical protein [Xaviernesmea rhizosphaerae]OQP84667.1 hypothetical protein BTR14_18785 [Xaviernesmea rhizosphaerae]
MLQGLKDADVETMLAALAGSSRRVQRVALSDRTIWIKRYGRRAPWRGHHLRLIAARLGPTARALAPSPRVPAEAMVAREIRQIDRLTRAGFRTPEVLYRSPTALVLSDLGPNVLGQMKALRLIDAQGHDALLVRSAGELGRLHGARLCHGRPHPRDFSLSEEGFGFMDFEEDPVAVMPLPLAQARDLWLLFLQVASRALLPETRWQALCAWRQHRPQDAETALARLVPMFARALPLARLVDRLRQGADITRFILATDFLRSALLTPIDHPCGHNGQNRFPS